MVGCLFLLIGAEEDAANATDAQNIKIGMLADSLVHAEQNAIDPDWLVKEFKRAGLEDDAPLVSLPKMPVGRG